MRGRRWWQASYDTGSHNRTILSVDGDVQRALAVPGIWALRIRIRADGNTIGDRDMRLLVAVKVIIDLSTFWKFGGDGSDSGLAAERIARGAVLLSGTILAFADAYKREGCNQGQ